MLDTFFFAAFLIALIAGLLSFIPNFGPIISALFAAAVGLSVRTNLALWILALFVLVQLLESNLITPFIERKAVYLPPRVILIMQAFMGLVFGILGLIVATFIVVGATTILKEYKAHK
ncbi:MAG: AI-2E family transporter [Candidatus Woesearchaeota archaeon]